MFGKPVKVVAQTPASKPEGTIQAVPSVPSIISADLRIEGNLSSTGEVQVDGAVDGEITCKALIVGLKGHITGEVNAQTVRMHGAVTGSVRAKSVFLAATARMCGDIEHENLAIEPGAYIDGRCRRVSEPVVTRHEPELPRMLTDLVKTAVVAS